MQVSATPGKTKHYQTHVIGSGDVVLVDGPGLVIPDLRMTKADMVLAGILPIDTLTDPLPCIDRLLQKVPFAYIQASYQMFLRPYSLGGIRTRDLLFLRLMR
jgi:large subunit GTPase 1